MTTVPLEYRSCVIYSEDPEFIASLDGIPAGTDKVYFKGLALHVPPWMKLRMMEVAEQVATSTNPNELLEQGVERVYEFTHDVEEAIHYRYKDMREDMEEDIMIISNQIPSNQGLKSMVLDKEWFPF